MGSAPRSTQTALQLRLGKTQNQNVASACAFRSQPATQGDWADQQCPSTSPAVHQRADALDGVDDNVWIAYASASLQEDRPSLPFFPGLIYLPRVVGSPSWRPQRSHKVTILISQFLSETVSLAPLQIATSRSCLLFCARWCSGDRRSSRNCCVAK
jgi:hypothetical protein